MQCSSLIWAPLKTISCRLSASAWPTLKQSQRPFCYSEHCTASHFSNHPVAQVKGNFWTITSENIVFLRNYRLFHLWVIFFNCPNGVEMYEWVNFRLYKKEKSLWAVEIFFNQFSQTLKVSFHLTSKEEKWNTEQFFKDSNSRNSKNVHILCSILILLFRFWLPCNSVFDVVEQTLWHERILI